MNQVTFSKATLALVDASITAWEDKRSSDSPLTFNCGPSLCPLCVEFIYKSSNCRGCPVAAFTGTPLCRASPYKDARVAHKAWECCNDPEDADFYRDVWYFAADKEIEFLHKVRRFTADNLIPDDETPQCSGTD